jgi:4-hydroxybenzoate polyprenyltransferase
MGQTNSNPVRLYTRYIRILKIIQYLGYFFVLVFLGLILASARGVSEPDAFSPIPLLFLLLLASGMIGVVTQALIAIVDLLSRIEQNTRPQ